MPRFTSEIKSLLYKEALLDLRFKSIFLSTVIYVFSTVFICYLSIQTTTLNSWNALVWITILFAITNAANKIFLNESGYGKIYTYTLARPGAIILSKIIYQWIISTLLASMVMISWLVLFNRILPHPFHFLVSLILGVSAMSNVLTLNNALATESHNSAALLAILSFPVTVPVLLTSIKSCSLSMMNEIPDSFHNYMLVLGLLNLLTVTLGYILFPYLWRH